MNETKPSTRCRQIIEAALHTDAIGELVALNCELGTYIVHFASIQGTEELRAAQLKERFKQAEAAKVLGYDGSVAAGERNAIIELADMRMEMFKAEAMAKQVALFRQAIVANSDIIKQKIAHLRAEWELARFQANNER
jgi:prophage tail gpP-like protein